MYNFKNKCFAPCNISMLQWGVVQILIVITNICAEPLWPESGVSLTFSRHIRLISQFYKEFVQLNFPNFI